MKLFILIFISLLTISPAQSMVNMRNGSYNEKWVDYIDPQPGIDLRIERFYSSRSLFIGLFGFGWCSTIETHLTVTSDGIINLTECGGGLEVTYYPKNFDLKSPEDTITRIIADYKKNNKKAAGNDLANLKVQLQSNTKMRFEYANKLGLVDIKKIKTKKNTFLAKSKGFEKISFDGIFYERVKFDGTVERYKESDDGKARLVQISQPSGQYLKIKYKGTKIAYLVDNKGRRLTFSYGPDGHLKKISNGKGLQVEYKFRGENLIEVKNMWSKVYGFHYDPNHNMTQVDFPDNTTMKMTYDVGKDWIKSYTNRKKCREDFDFFLDRKDPQNHYWGTFSRKCPEGKVNKGRHEFWYQNYSFSKDKYLHRVQENYKSEFKNVYFHPFLGRPVSIRENNVYRGFAYFLNGLVNKREHKLYTQENEIFKWDKTSFKYNFQSYQIIETVQTFLNKLGKVTHSEKTNFSYNKNGFLSQAKKKKDQFLSLVYDENGKLDKIKDHKNNVIKLTYKVGIEKPVEIEHVNTGKVTITYSNDGQVESIDAGGKRNIATSVIEKFLSMISFLGPVGEELKI